MPTTSPVLLILGAGPRVGQSVAKLFSSKGYKVALAARSLTDGTKDGHLHVKADFSRTDDIVQAFAKVKKELGIPSVVVYNAGSLTPSPPEDPFAVPLEAYERDMVINSTSVFVAAQQAVQGFKDPALAAHAQKAFFFTGNILNVTPLPSFMDAGAGKAASAHMMMAAAAAYKDQGYKFYYVDERKPDGSAAFKIDGDAHAKLFYDLANAKRGPWLQSFVKGEGYKDFRPYRL